MNHQSQQMSFLHLKCSLKDINNNQVSNDNNLIGDPLNYNASVPPTIQAFMII